MTATNICSDFGGFRLGPPLNDLVIQPGSSSGWTTLNR